MRYYFSKEEFDKLRQLITIDDFDYYNRRKELIETHFPNINYMEFATLNTARWGCFIGKEKDINWVLLHL